MMRLKLCNRRRSHVGVLLLFSVLLSQLTIARALAGQSSSKKRKKQTHGGGFGKPAAGTKNAAEYIPDDSPAIRSLVKVLKEEECEGIGAEGGTEIGICSTTGRRGLFAADDYQAGELMLGIPFPCCVTLAMDDISVGEPSDAELGLRLLNLLSESEHRSCDKNCVDFAPYFQSFPTLEENFDATPDFWTVPEIEQLELPFIIQRAMERKESIGTLAQSQKVDQSQLQFATWLVKSRGFTLLKPMVTPNLPTHDTGDAIEEPVTTIVSKTVLIPYIDMINHCNPESANAEMQVLETKVEDESFYALQATRFIRKGTEITIAYGTGKESTADLLAGYGFIPSKNTNDAKFM